jgi:hypothetical protein
VDKSERDSMSVCFVTISMAASDFIVVSVLYGRQADLTRFPPKERAVRGVRPARVVGIPISLGCAAQAA